MDPITGSIIAAITSGVVAGLTSIASDEIMQAYNKLKQKIASRFGNCNGVNKAIEDLEGHPDSDGRKKTLQEEIEASKVGQDSDVQKLAEELLTLLKSNDSGQVKEVLNQISGHGNITFTGSSASGSIFNTGDINKS